MRSFIIIPLSFALACPLFAFATFNAPSLMGKVTERSTGEPVPGAQIWFPDLRRGTTSRGDGSYAMEGLPVSKLLVQVSMIGFATLTERIDLTTTATHDFVLVPSVKEMSAVVITGTSKATELKRDPVPTTLIDPRYIRLNSSSNVIETLNKVPGVNTLTTGPNVSKPYIRGLGSNRILTLFDGVRQEGQQWGDEHGIEVDQYLIDRIEVVKGPASLMYGSDALAGVVNLLPGMNAADSTVAGSVLGEYDSNNKGLAGSFAIDGKRHGLIWGARLSHKQATNYQNRYDGRVAGTKFQENDANVHVGIDRTWGYSHLAFSLFDDLQEIPDGSRDPATGRFTRQVNEEDTLRSIINDADLGSYDIAVLHQHVQHYRVHSASSIQLGSGRMGANLGYQKSIRREFNHPEYPALAGLYLELNTFTYDVKYYLPEAHGWETTVGVNGMVQHNDADRGTEFVIPTYDDVDAGPFAHLKRSFDKLDLSGGVRFDSRTFRNKAMFTRPDVVTGFDMVTDHALADTTVVERFDAYAHTFHGLSGSVGLAYRVNDRLTLKANIARGYRAPNAAEITARGVHPGTGFAQLGDADLEPEFNLQQDLGLFYDGTHVSASAELFNNDISNYIYDEKLVGAGGGDSLFTHGGSDLPVFKFRQTSARLLGGELSIDVHPHPLDWLHFENSISLILAENKGGNGASITDSTRYLPFIPPLHTNSEIRADLRKPWGPFTGIFLKLGVQLYAAQDRFFAAYGTETRTPGYTLMDAGLGGDVVDRKGRIRCTITVLGSNLADVAYQSNMNRLKYFDDRPAELTGHRGIYNMGRNISVKVVVPFTIGRSGR